MKIELKLHKPYPPQKAFFHSSARYTMYGGARGGGKSDAARSLLVQIALKHPGVQMLLLRRLLTDLRENHLFPLLKMLKGVAIYREQTKEFRFVNGSRLVLGYCDAERDTLKYQGQNYDVILMEEATQFTERQFDLIKLSNRPSGLCRNFRPRMYFTCNPGGVGHNWVKRRWISRQFRQGEKPEDFTFIPARVYDNEFLMKNDPDYVHVLETLPEAQRKAFLLGDWDVFEGQYFTEFSRDVHVVQPFPIPAEWRRYIALDYGLDMLACYWIAVDFDGWAYVYREIKQPNLIISAAAERIRALMQEPTFANMAPPDMWNRRQETGKSVAEIFAENGLMLTKANNDRIAGWMDLHEWLRPCADRNGKTGARLRFFANCAGIINDLPALTYSEKNPSDCATEPHEITHGPDAIRYFVSGRPLPAQAIVDEDYKTETESFLSFGQ